MLAASYTRGRKRLAPSSIDASVCASSELSMSCRSCAVSRAISLVAAISCSPALVSVGLGCAKVLRGALVHRQVHGVHRARKQIDEVHAVCRRGRHIVVEQRDPGHDRETRTDATDENAQSERILSRWVGLDGQ